MLSHITGSYQTEKASQEQFSDKAAAGVAALAKLIQIVGKDSDSKVERELLCAAAVNDSNMTSSPDSARTRSWCNVCLLQSTVHAVKHALPAQVVAQASKDLVIATEITSRTEKVFSGAL